MGKTVAGQLMERIMMKKKDLLRKQGKVRVALVWVY